MSCNHYNDTESVRWLLGRETAGSIVKWNDNITIVCCQWKEERKQKNQKESFSSYVTGNAKQIVLQWLSIFPNEWT